MIEWLDRVEPDRPFLISGDRTWTYGDALAEVRARLVGEPRLLTPTLSASSVFDLIAGISGGGATAVGPGIDPPDPAPVPLVVFTSGTTGRPRGVRLTMTNLQAAADASARHLGHGQDDNWLLAMPLHHVAGLSVVVRQAFTGGSVTILPGPDARSFAAALNHHVTMTSVVPTMLRRILDYGPFSGLKAVLVGGGPIPERLLTEAASVGLPVLPTYGMTETFGQVATLKPGSPLEKKAHPLPGIALRIEDDRRIAVRGDQVSPGYLGEADREDAWFITNDLGDIDDEGALRVLGRADLVIVTGGENVNPEQVEAVIRQHPGVQEVVVVGAPDEEWGEVIVCVYEGDARAEALSDWAAGRLPNFMVPKRWEHVVSMVRTEIGKLDRQAALDRITR